MTKDFANKKRSEGKPRPAASKRHNEAPRSQIPGWIWLLTGTVLGAFIMFLIYLSGLAPERPSARPSPSEKRVSEEPAANVPKPRFDFYKLLKETEVPVAPTTHSDQKHSSTQATKIEYILQVGSFKRRSDADRLRAELILLNLEAKIESVKQRNGDTWHRVMVGPYQSRSKMSKARSILVSNEIEPLLLKRQL